VAYLVFLTVLALTVGVLARACPNPQEGTSKVFGDRLFFVFLVHWGLEKYIPRPFLTHIQLLTGLRTIYYRLRGTQIAWSTHLSPGAVLFGPGLMKFGHLTYIGDGANLATHLSQGDKLIQAPVTVGDRCSLGAHVNVGPGCTFGADVRIGALTDIAPGAWIEDEVEIGPACQLGMGVKIGKGARLEPRTFLGSWTNVPAGEVWGGDPGRKLGEVSVSKGALRRRQRRRIGG
jgi:carbonic anhydrase/acetyltransferase-like protein (isoleucine patch superfamily)